MQGFRIRAPEGWPLLQRRVPALDTVRAGCHGVRCELGLIIGIIIRAAQIQEVLAFASISIQLFRLA
jgi:hypothetical protein